MTAYASENERRHHALEVADQPVFLVGSERSGTTMLRLMLDGHPSMSFGEEFEFAVEHLTETGVRPDLDWYHRELADNRIFGTSGFEVDPAIDDYDTLVRGFLASRVGDATVVGATVHFAFDRILHIWPDARFIHIVRDPRDVGPSCIQMGWAGNAWFGLDKWIESEQDWENFTPMVSPERVCEVRFEQLVTDHEGELGRLCEFVGLEFDPAMMDYVGFTDYSMPSAQAASRWRRGQSADDIRLMEARLGDWLDRRGYQRSDHDPLDPASLDLEALRRSDRIGRIRFRIDRYGLPLTAAEVVAGALPFGGLRSSVRQRMNTIERAHLRKSWR